MQEEHIISLLVSLYEHKVLINLFNYSNYQNVGHY